MVTIQDLIHEGLWFSSMGDGKGGERKMTVAQFERINEYCPLDAFCGKGTMEKIRKAEIGTHLGFWMGFKVIKE